MRFLPNAAQVGANRVAALQRILPRSKIVEFRGEIGKLACFLTTFVITFRAAKSVELTHF